MKKAKLIVLSSALSLVTIGVFAGKSKFAPQNVYADLGGTRIQLVTNTVFNDLSTSMPPGGSQAKIIGSGGTTSYNLVTNDGGSWLPLYTQSF